MARQRPTRIPTPHNFEIDRIVIRDVQYQFEVNRCRNEEVNFQGSSAYSVGGDSGQDGRTDDMSKFHEDWEKNVSSRLFTCCHYIHIKKTAPLLGDHVFLLITTIFKLVRNIHITNVLTKFHDD
ncbi:hypothetical protein DPMN_158617 [Dreissena polymorpha]|uniref:Uncharacterized protein n=1 Tax=Dreissena polymorpha TaxID=45954 RepID=A0A9D4EMM9_DREPO|nr:hypothetical protein DPMN_158617 [Dreissena polymorpha]